MWLLNNPGLEKAKRDIDELIAHCNKLDSKTDRPLLEQLYEDYDKGQGEVTAAQLAPTAAKRDIIKNQYIKTSGKDPITGNDKSLVYLRNELLEPINAEKCPYCGINQPNQLDHYMDKSSYGQLAVCRLNLIPLCGQCNWLKSNKPYTEFMHPYYRKVESGVIFLVADCTIVRRRVCVRFRIDGEALGDTVLESRLVRQISNMHLDKRLKMAVNEFLTNELLRSHVRTNEDLDSSLAEIQRYNAIEYGDNDWRTAVIRGLRNCATFDITIVEYYRKHPHRVNGGALL